MGAEARNCKASLLKEILKVRLDPYPSPKLVNEREDPIPLLLSSAENAELEKLEKECADRSLVRFTRELIEWLRGLLGNRLRSFRSEFYMDEEDIHVELDAAHPNTLMLLISSESVYFYASALLFAPIAYYFTSFPSTQDQQFPSARAVAHTLADAVSRALRLRSAAGQSSLR